MRENEAPKTIYLKDYKEPDFWVDNIDLNFAIHDGYTDVTAVTQFKRNGTHDNPLVLDGEELELLTILLDGDDPEYSETKDILTVDPKGKDSFTLTIQTRIKPEENTALEGLYKSGDMYATQCEAQGFRRITYYLDRPDVMTSFRVRIEADQSKYPILLSNGNPVDQGDLDEGRHFVTWEDPHKKPCYLFALVAGDLECRKDTFKTMSGRNVDLHIYVRKGDIDQTEWAMDSLKRCMKWDEERFGREYDLDLFNIVAVSDFNMAAMENKSLNIFNISAIAATPELSTDTDFFHVDRVIAHEYFHNWSGNRVTCRDWFQLSLKEGFTIFRDQQYSMTHYNHDAVRIDEVSLLRNHQFPEDAGPIAHPIRPESYIAIDNFYTTTVYHKGAEVIRMMHTLMGEEKFRKACDLYFDRFDGQAVTCDDFVDCMEEVSGVDLAQFRLWYSQAGTPQMSCKGEYDPLTQSYSFSLYQNIPDTPGQTNKKPMHIPVKVGLLNEKGEDMIGTQTLFLRDPSQIFTFEGLEEEPAAHSVLRGFSAPVQMDARLNKEQLAHLMIHDTDGFNKWEAGQKMVQSFLLPGIYALEEGKDFETEPLYIDAISKLLENEKDKMLLSHALSLPAHSYIAQLRETIDPLSIYNALKQVKRDVANTLHDSILKLYREQLSSKAYDPTPEEMGRRALQNTLLGYLFETEAPDIALAEEQYTNANNMTDRVAALKVLNDTDSPARAKALDNFYDRYKDHELVVNKWFSIQAMAERDSIIDDIKALRKHSVFTLKNPNRARSLYGVFAMYNVPGFHNKDGSGYELVRDVLIELDDINPQVTARMAGVFLQWKKYAQPYQSNMKKALEAIAAKRKISPNTYEVVTKALES